MGEDLFKGIGEAGVALIEDGGGPRRAIWYRAEPALLVQEAAGVMLLIR